MQQSDPNRLVIDDVVIDFVGRRLSRAGVEQPLEPKAFAVLSLLAQSPGRVVERDVILDAVWGHRHVTQGVLNRVMSLLRQALGENAQDPRRLHTVHGVGYRFDLPATPPACSGFDSPYVATTTTAESNATHLPASRRYPILGAALALALVATAWLVGDEGEGAASRQPQHAEAGAQRPSLAVLPFADLSQARDQQYLADGLAEEILNQLAQSSALRVIGRTSSFSFRDITGDLRRIGRQLDAAFLLEGSVRKDGERLRVTAQLIRADDGSHLWSKTYARELRDVFAVQDDIARDVALALSVRLDVATYNREQGGTTHVEAYERYLRWRDIVMREQFDLPHDRERVQLAREMLALDADCVLCRDALASSLLAVAREVGGTQADILRAEARQVREDITRMAPDSWVARRDRANALWRDGRRAEAITLAAVVAGNGPLSKERVWDYSYMLYAMGHIEDTIALVERVRAVEPRALFLSRDLQYDYTAARRFDEAEAEYRRGRELEGSQWEPDYVAFMRRLAGHGAGDPAELHERLLTREAGDASPFFRDLGHLLADRDGMLDAVRKALADPDYGGGAGAAETWGNVADALGDADLAVAAMRRAMESKPGFTDGRMAQDAYVTLWNSPYSGVRTHPAFKRLLVESGVVDYWRQTGRWGDGCEPVGAEDFRCR